MSKAIAKIKLGPSRVGYHDPLTNIYLTLRNPETEIYAYHDTKNIKYSVKCGELKLIWGTLEEKDKVKSVQTEAKTVKPEVKKPVEPKVEVKAEPKVEKVVEPVVEKAPAVEEKVEVVEEPVQEQPAEKVVEEVKEEQHKEVAEQAAEEPKRRKRRTAAVTEEQE